MHLCRAAQALGVDSADANVDGVVPGSTALLADDEIEWANALDWTLTTLGGVSDDALARLFD